MATHLFYTKIFMQKYFIQLEIQLIVIPRSRETSFGSSLIRVPHQKTVIFVVFYFNSVSIVKFTPRQPQKAVLGW